jgi:hypothetical protein
METVVGPVIISARLLNILLVPIVALWALHLYQRKFRDAGARKRAATLALTLVVIGAWAVTWLFNRFGIPDVWLIAVAGAAAAVIAWQHRRMLPFRRRCARCGKAVPVERILGLDSNTCEACEPPVTPNQGETTR